MSSICQEKEMIDLIFSMYQLSGGSDGEVFRKLTESEQTVCRSVVFSKLFFTTEDYRCKVVTRP
jgi:hypothetical protein